MFRGSLEVFGDVHGDWVKNGGVFDAQSSWEEEIATFATVLTSCDTFMDVMSP